MSKQATRVVVLAFEGPDSYSFVGGLAVRVTELIHAFADANYETQLVFVGAPDRPSVERIGPNLELRRFCQWISAFHPGGVYDGEAGKINDYSRSVPTYLVNEVIAPAAERGERVLILAEDWQTADAIISLDRTLRARGIRHAATLVWNANNTYGFSQIDLRALAAASTITAVSKYMKFELAAVGIAGLVLPNGIPTRLIKGPESGTVKSLRDAVGSRPFYVKVGRYSPDKAWMQAIEAVALLRKRGTPARLVVRGGKEAYGDEVMDRARALGLRIVEVRALGRDLHNVRTAIAASDGDIIDLRAFLEEPLLYALYAAADAVLANSKKEPFGLVGLEVMAAGGIAVCGSTGEEYAEPFVNAVVVDTEDGRELASSLQALHDDPQLATAIRKAARPTAERYTWPVVIRTLERKLNFMESLQN